MLKKYLAPFQVVTYAREDGNRAVYKILRPTKSVMTKKGIPVGFRAWKTRNSGVNDQPGWRSFREDRIVKTDFVFV